MEKFYKIKYIPTAFFCAYLVKVLTISASLPDFGIILVLGALTAFFEYKESQEFQKKLENLRIVVDHNAKIVEDLKTRVASLQLSQGFRPVNQAYANK